MMCRFNVGMCYSHVNINQQTWAEAWIKTNLIGLLWSSNVACDNWKHTTLVRTLQASMTKFQYCKHCLLINVYIKKKHSNQSCLYKKQSVDLYELFLLCFVLWKIWWWQKSLNFLTKSWYLTDHLTKIFC